MNLVKELMLNLYFWEMDATNSISIGWHFRTAHGQLSIYKTNFIIWLPSAQTSVSLLVSDLSEPLENQLQQKIKMNGKLLSVFLSVLLIATFQLENSEAFQPGGRGTIPQSRSISDKRLEEVRREISRIHSQIISYRADTQSFIISPCLRALKSTIFEPNSQKYIIFKKIEQGLVLIFVLFKPTISYLCFRLYSGYTHEYVLNCKPVFWIMNKVFCCQMHKSCVYLNSLCGSPGTCVRPLETSTVIGPSA